MTTTWRLRSAEHTPDTTTRRARVLLVWVMIAVGSFEALWLGVVTHSGPTGVDPGVVAWFAVHRTPGLVSVATVVTDLGSPAVMIAGAVLVVGWCAWRRDGRRVLLGAVGVVGVIGIDVGAKALVARPRPPVPFQAVVAHGYSFPSGHAMLSAGCVLLVLGLVRAALARLAPAVRALLVVGAALFVTAVGCSRVVLGVHYPSDVLAGWALAVLVVSAVGLLGVALHGSDA